MFEVMVLTQLIAHVRGSLGASKAQGASSRHAVHTTPNKDARGLQVRLANSLVHTQLHVGLFVFEGSCGHPTTGLCFLVVGGCATKLLEWTCYFIIRIRL